MLGSVRGGLVRWYGDNAWVLFVNYENLGFLDVRDLKTVVRKDDTKVIVEA